MAKPYTMQKDALQELTFMQIAMTEEGTEAYEKLNGILLILLGVIGPDGELTPAYANSPMWKVTEDNELIPSVIADLATTLLGRDLSEKHIREVFSTLDIDPDNAEGVRQWLQTIAKGSRHTKAGKTQ